MIAEFYLFDVEMGQAAALELPNSRWCIFDIGKSTAFSPVNWIKGFCKMSEILTDSFASVVSSIG